MKKMMKQMSGMMNNKKSRGLGGLGNMFGGGKFKMPF
jgi:hypothetical protein